MTEVKREEGGGGEGKWNGTGGDWEGKKREWGGKGRGKRRVGERE